MSILATDKKLISFGTDYSAGSGISIIDHTISIVPSAVGKTYSAGPNIDIYDVSGQPTISSKDWSSEISDASAGAVTQSTSYFNEWINGQYTGDITNITNNITALSGDLSGYYKKTETSSKEQINDALQYVSANAGKVYEGVSPIVVNNAEDKISADTWTLSAGEGVSFTDDSANKVTRIDVTAQGGDEGVNLFVTENSASIIDVNNSYKENSGTFLTAIPSDVATTGDVANLEQTISETYYPKSNPSSFATESWVTAQGYITAHQDISNKLDSSAFSSVSGDFLTTSFSIPESATWNDVSAKADTTALIPTIDSNAINYSAKPTDNPIYASGNQLKNVDYIDGKAGLAIVPNGVLQVPNVITATNGVIQVPNAITATNSVLQVPNVITAVPNNTLNVPGVITANQNYITANGLSANTYGLTANGLTADAVHSSFSANGISAGKQGSFIIQGLHESISSNNKAGFIFSSDDTNFSSATLTTAGINNIVGMPSPMFEARNISGAGFSIEASGAKGYDESGNVVWDTQNPQVKNIISYADTKTAQGGLTGNIILTTQPSTNASNLTNSPYVIMDAHQASYFASYGPSAQTPTVTLFPNNITFAYQAGNAKTTVGYNDVKQELSGSSWTLTGSIQKRELEYDANTSAITAINGSALAGQGGGGGSVSSKYGTILVSGSNIEATNKSIKFNSNGFTSSFDGVFVSYENPPVILTWDEHSQETSIFVQVYNDASENSTLTYSSNTNVTGEFTTGGYESYNFNVQIPNATAIQFSSDNISTLSHVGVSAPSSYRVSELAWKSDLPTYNYNSNKKLSAINGSALVGNEDYLVEQGFVQNLTSPKGTVYVINNKKIEGTNSAIASDVIEGFVSSYNDKNAFPGYSATLTWDRYVPNTMLFVSGAEYVEHTLTYSANTNVTGVITTPTGGQISVELPTDSTSIVIGNENMDFPHFNFTVSAEDKYEIGELAWASAIPTYEYDSTNKISAINGSAIAQPTLSSLNTAKVNNVIVTATLPSTPDANTLYLIPEA